jgi:two-component system invasion response regulator UvrY
MTAYLQPILEAKDTAETRSALLMDEQRPTRVLIAERHAALRAAARLFVQRQRGLAVVGEAADTQELLQVTEITRPEIVLLDWDLGDHSGVDVLLALRRLQWRPGVIVLDVQPESTQEALEAGADAFVSKSDPPQYLLDAIHGVRLARSRVRHSYHGEPSREEK